MESRVASSEQLARVANYGQTGCAPRPSALSTASLRGKWRFHCSGSIRNYCKMCRNEAAEGVRSDGSNDSLLQISPGDLQEEAEAVGVGGGQRYWRWPSIRRSGLATEFNTSIDKRKLSEQRLVHFLISCALIKIKEGGGGVVSSAPWPGGQSSTHVHL